MSDVILSKEALLKAALPESEYEIEGVGTIRIRGMSRAEVVKFLGIEDFDGREAWALICGVVEPELSEEEVQAWRAGALSAVIKDVAEEILRLSGMLDPRKAVADAKTSFQEEQ